MLGTSSKYDYIPAPVVNKILLHNDMQYHPRIKGQINEDNPGPGAHF